jgi:hypothetical protein
MDNLHHPSGYGRGAFMLAVESLARDGVKISVEPVLQRAEAICSAVELGDAKNATDFLKYFSYRSISCISGVLM